MPNSSYLPFGVIFPAKIRDSVKYPVKYPVRTQPGSLIVRLLSNRVSHRLTILSTVLLAITMVLLSTSIGGCGNQQIDFDNKTTWKTYKNNRYSFEFPYPNTWQIQPTPTNDDGVVLVSPHNPAIEIRGWAGNRLPEEINVNTQAQQDTTPNFQTQQGKKGILIVEVKPPNSVMKLTIKTNRLTYHWQGTSPTEEFDDYYRVFNYIARSYKITELDNRL